MARVSRAYSHLLLVALAIGWNLFELRAQTLDGVAYLNDSAVHEQMVRFATSQLGQGHFPLTRWYPYLQLGSPQFLHYQSLPALLAGLLGLVIGPDAAFRWTLYLLSSLWPLSVYAAARLFGFGRLTATASAMMSPFLVSIIGLGYEEKAYLWRGWGVWTQLWASTTLPLAWAASWRAVQHGRGWYLPAGGLVALTVALHFETGYLALLPLPVWALIAEPPLRVRIGRAALVGGGALLCSLWVLVPLLDQSSWAAINLPLQHTPLTDGYGAARVMRWLVLGGLLDAGRLPVITVLAAAGLVLALRQCRWDSRLRALIALLVLCVLLSFGRASFGEFIDVIPGARDIFFRRFMMGVQLVCLLLAGVGADAGARWVWRWLLRGAARLTPRRLGWLPTSRTARVFLGACLAAVLLAPAWIQLDAYAAGNASQIGRQRRADRGEGRQLAQLVAPITRSGDGRVYAGTPANWGDRFLVGAVPVYKYLAALDVQEVGFTLRTASLNEVPEYYFNERKPADYALFGVRYLILPPGHPPPIPARFVRRNGGYTMWQVDRSGLIQVGRVVGAVAADRADIGLRSLPVLNSSLAAEGAYIRVRFNAHSSDQAQIPQLGRAITTGKVLRERVDLTEGRAEARVRLRRPGVVVLSATFDPGWHASVDRRPVRTEMIAPAVIGVPVPAGVHSVAFVYVGYHGYAELLCLALLGAVGLGLGDRRACRTTRLGRHAAGHIPSFHRALKGSDDLAASPDEEALEVLKGVDHESHLPRV